VQISVLGSLRGRLFVLLALVVTAAIAASALMVVLFSQSANARAGEAEAQLGRACDAIAAAYRFYSSGWNGLSADANTNALHHDLTAVVDTALRQRPGIEGGIWQADRGSLAYGFPTYQGSGPKTDVPQAELLRIEAINRSALDDDRLTVSRYHASSEVLLTSACPLSGPISGLTAWTMTRVHTFAGSSYWLLMAGLGSLFAAIAAAAGLLTPLTLRWPRHIGRIEATLRAHDLPDLPLLPVTGERELDRIIVALNDAARRLSDARQRADELAHRITIGERLAAIGRVTAGLAHEIRNPIAAMRLKAENAIARGSNDKDQALSAILGQIERLEALLRRLLTVTERDEPRRELVAIAPFLADCVAAHAETAQAKGVGLRSEGDDETARFDPEQMRTALSNLILNAIQAAPTATEVLVSGRRAPEGLVFGVCDYGPGPAPEIREHLFEPFVTGRPDGTGLGLSIVREVAEAHGGTAGLGVCQSQTRFEIVIPWQRS
jgi:signal transduction histidine kinase